MSTRRSALALLPLLGCAGVGDPRVEAPRAWALPAAARSSGALGRGVAGLGAVSVRIAVPRDNAEHARTALIEALRTGDEGALSSLFATAVEGVLDGPQDSPRADGFERAAGRAHVVARLRAWQPVLVQGFNGAVGAPLLARLYAREDCTASSCGDVFLREGDWLLRLEHPMLQRRMRYPRSRVGASARSFGPEGAPPRLFVLREVDGAVRVVAVNDDLLGDP